MHKCKQCGFEFELKDDARYCLNCGNKADLLPQPAAGADGFTGTISNNLTIVGPEPADSSADLESGRVFHGRYQIDRKLGQGAMGIVYLAGDRLTGRQVALKLISSRLMNKASARERFLREGLIARDIRHKNVVAVYDVSETEGQYYLSMEYLSGVTLRNWLRNFLHSGNDIPYATAEKIIRNILEGLDAAHTAGVIHRDVKPENIMLTGNSDAGDYTLKILDFGIARAIDSSAKQAVTTTTSTGTALYMAPEQKTAADTVGPPADLYAVSAIFYELLLGVAPTGRWAPLSKEREDLPSRVDAVIDKGLSSRPRSRYQNAQEYLSAINEIQNAPLPSPRSSHATPASGIGGSVRQAQAPFGARSPSGLPKKNPAMAPVSAPYQPAVAQPSSFASGEPTPAPQIISRNGKLRTERLVWSNAPAEAVHESMWQALQAFGLNQMRYDGRTRTILGTTGFSWKSLGQKISATIDAVSGGSTANIVGLAKGPGLMDMGRGRNDVHTMSGMLIQKLAAAGWKAYVVREVQCSPPMWVIILIVIGWLLLLGYMPNIVEFLDEAIGAL
jgi:serine/threonine protein kinase